MNYLKAIFILFIFINISFANPINIYQYNKNIQNAKKNLVQKPKIKLTYNKNVKNAQTLLLELQGRDISDVKLTLKNINLKFNKNIFKKDTFYAVVPISYYQKLGKFRLIISYLYRNKRFFAGADIKILDAKYKSEKIKVQSSKVTLNKKSKNRTKKEYEEAMKIYKTNSKNMLWKDDFIMPMQSRITSAFGTKRVYNNKLKSFHSGIDFKAKVGTEIIASNDGIVRLAKNRFYAGNSIIIDHGQGIYTCYYHLSKILVKANQKVKRGQKIGLSGATGRITGPHLHFATRVHGHLVEPTNLISLLNKLNN